MANVRTILASSVAVLGVASMATGIFDLGDLQREYNRRFAAGSPDKPLMDRAPSSQQTAISTDVTRMTPAMPSRPAPDARPPAVAPLPAAATDGQTNDAPANLVTAEPTPAAETGPEAEIRTVTSAVEVMPPEPAAELPVTGPASMGQVRKFIRAREFAAAAAMLERLGDDPEALYLLATLHRKGDGVAQDDTRAFAIMSRAAQAGHLEAQFSLARMYLSGRGVEADTGQAQFWLASAAEQGHVGATEALVTLMTRANPLTPAPEAQPLEPRIAASDMAGRQGKSPLVEAAERGEMRVLRRLFADGAPPSTRDAKGRTPLMLAAAGGHAQAVGFLLEQGADARATDASGRTALMHAAARGATAVIDLLLAVADTRPLRDNSGLTASDIAFQAGQCASGVGLFSGTLAQGGETAIIETCTLADLQALHRAGFRFQQDDGRGRSPLWYAARAGNFGAVRFLSEAGYDAGDPVAAPLLVAINGAHADVATYLIENGADLDARTGSGNSALLIATTRGLTGVAAQLIEKGVNLDHRNADGYSALMLAAKYGREDLARLLIENGADTSLRNVKREQAFDIANAAGFAGIVALLN